MVGLLVGFVAGFAVASALPGRGVASARRNPPQLEEPGLGPVVAPDIAVARRPSRGTAGAPVTIVEFTDYECPFCRRHVQRTMPALLAVYGSRIRYVVRNYPIASLHPDAPKAAEAAECSHEQGRFWPYHDRLFRATQLDEGSLKRYAAELRLDTAAFNRCLDTGAKAEVVAQDVREARAYGARGTPAFFINGRLLVGAKPYEVFAAYIDAVLEDRSP